MRQHKCIYLRDETGKVLWCWQMKGKVNRNECTRCLLAYLVSGAYISPKHRLSAERRGAK
jgi:hypothetical protein